MNEKGRQCCHVWLLWFQELTVACQVPRSMGFSSQEHWSGLPFPSPGESPDPESSFFLMSLQHLVCECTGFRPQWYHVLICTLLMPYDVMFRFLLCMFLNILNSVFPPLLFSHLSLYHCISFLRIRAEDVCPYKSLHTNVYSSFIHNCQIPGASMISFCR